MNEFIVWDKENHMGEDKKFFTLDELRVEGFHFHFTEDFKTEIFELVDNDMGCSQSFLKHKTFPYIGKTDDTPEQNKIYADCSIVDYLMVFTDGCKPERYRGVFKYNNKTCSYDIVNDRMEQLAINSFWVDKATDFKVIGTLQENEELLK